MLPHCCKDPKSSGMNSRPTQDPTSMKTDHEKDARKNALHGDNAGLTPDLMAPWDPYFLEPPAQSDLDLDSHTDLVIEWMNKKEALLRTYGDTAIMYPDITPKEVNNNFYTIIDVLLPILEKDSPRRFLSFFENYGGWLVWRSRIIPEALNCLITENALKCAKVVLEGKAPELDGHRANPNWMSQYGHFPLHQAADIFAVDMIKLLLSKGASANVHMAGDTAIAGLLPLHVAVENTCLHKYLEDSLLPNREHPSYSKADVYKLIHLLCLPEMKVFLDACRELAKHTNGVVDEVWTYIKDGKLVQAGVLLLAAQEHIRLGPSCKKNGDSKPDGFAIILSHIANQFCSFDLGMGQNEREHEQPHADIKYLSSALLLVNVISQAGKALHEYIRVHSEVPHMVAIEHVSSILKDFGFCPPEEAMNIGNLCPYKCLHYEQLLGPPNHMNQYGRFPLHEAAETFSVDMIKLLIRKGVSANVHMTGNTITAGLLPLHVAVEKTCLHKYLEDNLLPHREHPSYSKADIYKLIHLLSLPEMKVFLDTTRELAKHTNDLVDEVWNYIKDGKLVHAGVLLLAAQDHIRLGSSSKKNGNSKPDGFATIVNRIADHFYTFDLEMGQNKKELDQQHANIKYLSSALLLVHATSQAGKTLHEYIRVHSEAPHVDVLQRVSLILKDFGFCPAEEGFDVGNLCLRYGELPDKQAHMVPTKKDIKIPCLHASGRKIETKKMLARWELGYKKAQFFPYWRSVLLSMSPVKLFPSHAALEALSLSPELLDSDKSRDKNSAPVQNDNLHLYGRIQQQVNHQPRRSLSTAAAMLKLCMSRKAPTMEKEHKKDAMKNDSHEDSVGGADGLTPDLMASWHPYFLKPPAQSNLDSVSYTKVVIKWVKKKKELFRMYGGTSIMYPDITPKSINNNFYITMEVLLPILEKDCPRRFLDSFEKYGGWIVWRSMIIPEALDCLITENAVKCAKVVLEGNAPELQGYRANPNWMTQYGYFPLHQAAETFSVDMIKLLISKGASANVRTAGGEVIEGLLPLHVAVENTCLHKYLEDNLLPNREHPSYSKADIYKLVHLLCLPEMKCFLDATRELAKHTDDLVDEIWYYIRDGKLVQAGVLLFAAQEHIREESSCKKNGNSKPDRFATVVNRITNHFYAIDFKMGHNDNEHEQPHVEITYLSSALLLVNAISQAGKALNAYIRAHREVPHADVLERVSSVLKDFGFCPTEGGIDISNLTPYKCYGDLSDNHNNRSPLHQAAKTFSVDMVKLLIRKGASANVRVANNTVVEGLLPLHVAVENICSHKYLEDNLLSNREHPS